MNDQHKKISGYRDLTQEEIDLMNELKQKEREVLEIIARLQENKELDQRWAAIAKTDIQTGFMAAVRSVARPL